MCGLSAAVALIYAMACAPVSYSPGILCAAVVGFGAGLIAAGAGWFLVEVAGIPVGLPIYGAVLGLVIWHTLFWVRTWPWATAGWLGAGDLGQGPEVLLTKEMLEGKCRHRDWVRYTSPGGKRFSGLVMVAEETILFQTRYLIPGKPNGYFGEGRENTIALNFGLDIGDLFIGRSIFAIQIANKSIAKVKATRGLFGHTIVLSLADGKRHVFRCGLFPAWGLLTAIAAGAPATAAQEATWSALASRLCREAQVKPAGPYLLWRCSRLSMAETLVANHPEDCKRFLRERPKVIPFPDGTGAARFPLRNGSEVKAFIEGLFKGDFAEKIAVTNGLVAGASNEDNRVVLATLGHSQGSIFGNVLLFG
jgi:hypothetical protein